MTEALFCCLAWLESEATREREILVTRKKYDIFQSRNGEAARQRSCRFIAQGTEKLNGFDFEALLADNWPS